MAKKKQKTKQKMKPAFYIAIAVVLVIIISLSLLVSMKKSDAPVQNETPEIVEDIKEVVEEVVEEITPKTCEELAEEITPDTFFLTKNSLDPLWSFLPDENEMNTWSNGEIIVPDKFLRYQLTTGNVYKAEKPLISKEVSYFIYEDENVSFEVNPIFKSLGDDHLIIEEGYGGQLFYTQEFDVVELGIVNCELK